MSYLFIEDFRLGLDRTKKQYAGLPGSLWECTNAHITRGGDVEKRKAFVSKYSIPTGTFGLQAANDTLYVFGSGVDPGVPAGLTYKRCQHPDGVEMSEILASTAFDGLPYCVAEFTDGSIHHFYNGTLVAAWANGVVRAGMTNNSGIATHLAGLLSGASTIASAAAVGAVITVTGLASGASFTLTTETDDGGGTDNQTAAVATTTPAIAGVTEVLSTTSFAVTGGTGNTAATGTLTVTGGTAGAGNELTALTVNGVDILGGAVAWVTSNDATATAIAAQITSNVSSPEYTAAAVGAVVTISAATSVGAGANGFVVAKTDGGTFTSTVADMAGGVTNGITGITVNGVQILGATVPWVVSNSGTATNVAAQINTYVSSPEYSASASGGTVTISAAAGSGATPNGFVVAISVTGTATAGAAANMAGGVSTVAGQAQVSTITIGGTFEVGDRFTIILSGTEYGASGNPASKGTLAKTFKSKLYSAAGSVAYNSALNSAILWNSDVDVGANSQNIAGQDEGSATLTAIGDWLGNLVYFSRYAAQVWSIDADPDSNVLLSTVKNTGTVSPKSVLQYGNANLFYLADAGIRGIRPKDASNSAIVSDVGMAIDPLVASTVAALSAGQLEAAASVIEPIDGRLWMAVGSYVFVFSYFEAKKISAFSLYSLGFQVTEWAVVGRKVYGRSGNTVYLYGGDSGEVYDTGDADAYTVTVTLPFLTAGKPATSKTLTQFNAALSGTWDVYLLIDPENVLNKVTVGEIDSVTYKQEAIGITGETTHFAPQFICTTPGAATISNLAVHYDDGLQPNPG